MTGVQTCALPISGKYLLIPLLVITTKMSSVMCDEDMSENLECEEESGDQDAMFKLAERVEMLTEITYTFRGWNSDMFPVKQSIIEHLVRSKRNIKEICSVIKDLDSEKNSAIKQGTIANDLKQKSKYISEHIPKQFNCPTQLVTVVNTDENIAGSNKHAAAVATKPQVSNNSVTQCPEILFLTIDEFEKVPKYLKGRVTYEKINSFIEVFNRVLSCKYAIFKKKKSALKKKDADLWNEYHKQELMETKGLYFCVANDFKMLLGSTVDKISLNMLTILRHCGRIREIRTGGIVRYIALF